MSGWTGLERERERKKETEWTTMNDEEHNKQMEMLCMTVFLPIVEIV